MDDLKHISYAADYLVEAKEKLTVWNLCRAHVDN